MKRILTMLMAMLLLVSLAACSKNGDGAGDKSGSKAASFTKLMDAFKKDGYGVEVYADETAADWGIDGTTSFNAFGFYEEIGALEKFGDLFFAEFKDENDAIAAFNEFCQMLQADDIPVKYINGTNGKKATLTEGSDKFGARYTISQVENTIVYVLEEWDIDGNDVYDDGAAKILGKFGY